jgi:hypothetical protein
VNSVFSVVEILPYASVHLGESGKDKV